MITTVFSCNINPHQFWWGGREGVCKRIPSWTHAHTYTHTCPDSTCRGRWQRIQYRQRLREGERKREGERGLVVRCTGWYSRLYCCFCYWGAMASDWPWVAGCGGQLFRGRVGVVSHTSGCRLSTTDLYQRDRDQWIVEGEWNWFWWIVSDLASPLGREEFTENKEKKLLRFHWNQNKRQNDLLQIMPLSHNSFYI